MSFNDYGALSPELENELYARHTEIKSLEDLSRQRATPIPALFSMFYKFIQNPSTVSVETYKRMVDTDDTVGSGVDFLTTLLAARLGGYRHPSDEITQWVNEALARVDGGFTGALKELLTAVWSGFAVQEQVWGNTDIGFVVESLVTLPPTSVLFETERTGKLTPDGILQYQRGYNPSLMGGSMFGSGFASTAWTGKTDPYAKMGDLPFPIRTGNTFNYMSVRIPVQKCIHWAFDAQGRFGNPYGRSLLRRTYNFWVLKNALLQMMATAMDRKGTPILVVYADPNTTLQDPSKGNIGQGAQRGMPGQGIRADQAALKAFENIHNDTVIVLPGKKGTIFEVDPVDVTANAEEFIASIDRCDKGIIRGLLIPALIFSSGDGAGSYALGEAHSKTFDKIMDSMLAPLKHILLQQHIGRMIRFNFPESAWKRDGFGDFNKRDFDNDEMDKIISSYERVVNLGAADMSDLEDLNKVRETAGFSMRKEIIKTAQDLMPNSTFNVPGEEGEEPIPGQEGEQQPGQFQPLGGNTNPNGNANDNANPNVGGGGVKAKEAE